MDISEKLIFINQAKAKRKELVRQSKTKEEVDLLKQIVDCAKDVYGKDSDETIEILNELGGVAKYTGEYELAINSILEARDIISSRFNKKSVPYATTTLNLAEVYRYKGDIDKLEPLYLETKKIYEENNMTKTYEYSGVCNNLGLYYQEIGQAQKALDLHKISYAILKEFDRYKVAVATTFNNMALAYRALGDIEKSDEYIEKCLVMYEKELGKEHAMYSAALNSLAISLYRKGDFEKSLELFEKCLVICRDSFGSDGVNYKKIEENIKVVKESILLEENS